VPKLVRDGEALSRSRTRPVVEDDPARFDVVADEGTLKLLARQHFDFFDACGSGEVLHRDGDWHLRILSKQLSDELLWAC
jgi:hypothetical protein